MDDEASETKKENWLPWIVAAVAVFFVLRGQDASKDDALKPVTAVVKETIPNIRQAYRQAFLDAAAKIESKEIKTAEQWTKFIADNAGAKQREALDRVYQAIDAAKIPASFEGKEAEIAKLNRDIGGAW